MDVLQHYRSSYIMERWTLSAIFPGLKKCWRLQTGKEKKNSIKVKGKHFGCIMRYIFFLLDKNPLMLLFTDYGHPDRKQPLQPKIQSRSQIFRYGQSIFCLPHRPKFSDKIYLCLHWVSVVPEFGHKTLLNLSSKKKGRRKSSKSYQFSKEQK